MRFVFPFRDRSLGVAAAWMVPALLTIVVAASMLASGLRPRLPDAPPLGQVWVATPNTVEAIASGDERLARLYFGRSTSYVLSGGWASARPTMAWANERRFEVALAQGEIPANVRVVMYDPESWAETPPWERRHPGRAMQLFSDVAHEAGFEVVLTPHPGLVDVSGASCSRAADESIAAAFIRCRIMGEAARLGDVVEVQAQFLEAEPAAYRNLVQRATEQARAANPDVVVLAGLSTRFASDPQVLLDAWLSVSDVVDGHYMAVPDGFHADVATRFLRMLTDQGA
jgi:hypothetical protein